MLKFYRDIETQARQAGLRHRRRGLQGGPAGSAGAAGLCLAQPALGHRAQIPRRTGRDGAGRYRHPGRPHRQAGAGGAAEAGHGRRRGGAERHLAQRRRDRAHGCAHRRHGGDPARRRRDPADRARDRGEAAARRQALQISRQMPGLRQPCRARGGREDRQGGCRPALHRRADLSDAQAVERLRYFVVATSLRHRRLGRHHIETVPREGLAERAGRYLRAWRKSPTRSSKVLAERRAALSAERRAAEGKDAVKKAKKDEEREEQAGRKSDRGDRARAARSRWTASSTRWASAMSARPRRG